jgi:hypothetical protein
MALPLPRPATHVARVYIEEDSIVKVPSPTPTSAAAEDWGNLALFQTRFLSLCSASYLSEVKNLLEERASEVTSLNEYTLPFNFSSALCAVAWIGHSSLPEYLASCRFSLLDDGPDM